MNYSETITMKQSAAIQNTNILDVTTRTFTIETDDHDEISCAGTMVTAVIENSDSDEYLLFSTVETRELEAADSEEISYLMADSTIMTKVFEATDNDE